MKHKILLTLIITVALSLLLTIPAIASNGAGIQKEVQQSNSTQPGFGYGDKNHTHTGPPGQSNERPGWGYGDSNHIHTGPPGQSSN